MKTNKTGSLLEFVSVLLLFFMFMLSLCFSLLTAGSAYGAVSESDGQCYNSGICSSYILSKLRHCEVSYGIPVIYTDKIFGTDALVLAEFQDKDSYRTYIYCYDGYIRELYTDNAGEAEPEDGETIAEAVSFSASEKDNLLKVEFVTPDGQKSSFHYYIKTAEAESDE